MNEAKIDAIIFALDAVLDAVSEASEGLSWPASDNVGYAVHQARMDIQKIRSAGDV